VVEFEVVEMDPPKYGIVTQDTIIYCGSTGHAVNESKVMRLDWSLVEHSRNHLLHLFNFNEKLRMIGEKLREHLSKGTLGGEKSYSS
jgi:hypothetical protein